MKKTLPCLRNSKGEFPAVRASPVRGADMASSTGLGGTPGQSPPGSFAEDRSLLGLALAVTSGELLVPAVP